LFNSCSTMSQEKLPHFGTAISAIFKNWTALQLAVNHNAGGPQSKEKAEWMEESLETWFYQNKDLEPYEVEEFLGDIIEAEFQLQIDDGSLREVGCKVCEFFRICSTQSQEKVIEKLQTLPRCDLSQCKVEEGEEMDEENGEVVVRSEPVNGTENVEGMDNMEISSSHKEPEVDEDGFQMVSKKKGGRKK